MTTPGSDRSSGAGQPEQDIEEYWTNTRREEAQARPYEPTELPPETAEPGPAPDPEQSVEGSTPAGREGGPPDRAGAPEAGNPFAIPRDWIDVNPYLKIGKLFFTVNDANYTGSACVVGRRLLLTAAHNLYLDGVWSQRILFVPGAWDNYGDFGDWWFGTEFVPDAWGRYQRDADDVGVVQLVPGGADRRAPRPIGDVVGWLQYLYDGDPAGRSWRDVGYPRNYGNKLRMYAQDGDYRRRLDAGGVVGMTGVLAAGISGGPWLLWDRDYWPTVYGLHSFHTGRYPGEVFSPYFARWVHDFIQRNL
jgi:V8-like Glu-specific endopeptidase